MRVALLSDIHGNLTAFEAVLADTQTASIDQVIFLGDAATLGPHANEVVELLRGLNCPCVLGNHESYQLNLAQFLRDDHAEWAKETIAWSVVAAIAAELGVLEDVSAARRDSTQSRRLLARSALRTRLTRFL